MNDLPAPDFSQGGCENEGEGEDDLFKNSAAPENTQHPDTDAALVKAEESKSDSPELRAFSSTSPTWISASAS